MHTRHPHILSICISLRLLLCEYCLLRRHSYMASVLYAFSSSSLISFCTLVCGTRHCRCSRSAGACASARDGSTEFITITQQITQQRKSMRIVVKRWSRRMQRAQSHTEDVQMHCSEEQTQRMQRERTESCPWCRRSTNSCVSFSEATQQPPYRQGLFILFYSWYFNTLSVYSCTMY